MARKNYYKERFYKTKKFKLLLSEGLIVLTESKILYLCKSCNVYKTKNTQNFYLKFIRYENDKYIPILESKCIDCIINKQKEKGKFYNSKKNEAITKIRQCKECKDNKAFNNDNFRLTQGKYLRKICIVCDRKKANESTKKRLIYARDSIRISKRKYQSNRRKKDPAYKLRKYTSTSIYRFLKRNGANKRGKSIMNYLPYSMIELKIHLEHQFEPWMNWSNMGKYNPKTWNDNDFSTWTWNVDHIIPHSLLIYTSMEDENFKKCWSLDNLRPYSAKLNVIEGNKRV